MLTPQSRRACPLPQLDLPSDPLVLAERLQHLPGFVFLDSAIARPGEQASSVIAAHPCETIIGEAADWHQVEAAIRRHRAPDRIDAGSAFGALIGSVDYDGSFHFAVYPDLLRFRHMNSTWEIAGVPQWIAAAAEPRREPGELTFQPRLSQAAFVNSVQQAQELIAAGDIYQVNLSQPFDATFDGDAFSFYENLRAVSPAPNAAFLRQTNRIIISSSPETFLSFDGRRVQTRPIKGTRPRFRDSQRDERSAYELITSPKEVSELVMITDLMRNDLGRVCEYGSVTVTELLKLERFAQVFHLVSTVEGRLRSDVSHAAALRSAFPGGSVTGAPKKRAMEVIAELEAFPRGLFTGVLGYFGFDNESQFSIAIRTVEVSGGRASFHVGAGIVADSDPEAEYHETLHKAAGILLAAAAMKG